MIRLGQASRKLNVGHNTILDFLAKKGFTVENNPNAKLTGDQFAMLAKEFASSASEKIEASILTIGAKHTDEAAYARFFHAMLSEGIAMAPGAYEALFVGLAHTDDVLEQIAEAAQRAAKAAASSG